MRNFLTEREKEDLRELKIPFLIICAFIFLIADLFAFGVLCNLISQPSDTYVLIGVIGIGVFIGANVFLFKLISKQFKTNPKNNENKN